MAKKELKEQLKSYEGYINDIPLVIDPCKQCKNVERKNEEQIEKCRLCCWYYTSSFEMNVEAENLCCNCGYNKLITSGKEPCKSCDNGSNFQDKTTPCYYSRKGENKYQYSTMGIVDPVNYDYISARQYHERYEDTK